MKKRIISLALFLVMLALTLTGCAYNYTKVDYLAYSTFDTAAFRAALSALEIEDGDFTADETKRQEKVKETIQKTLADLIVKDDTRKLTEGVIADTNVVLYCYYATFTDEKGELQILRMSNMKESAPQTLRFIETEDKLHKLIIPALTGFDLVKAYKTTTEGTVKAGDRVVVSYTKDEGDASGIKVAYEILTVEEVADTFGNTLIGKEIGKAFATETTDDAVIKVGDVTYKNVTINWVITSGEEVTVNYKPYTKETTETNIYGVSVPVNEETELTYHLYPVCRYEVPDFENMTDYKAVETIIFDIFGDEIDKSSLDAFTNSDFKYEDAENDNKEVTLESIITDLAKKYTVLEAAQKEYDDKIKTDPDNATEEKEALDQAKADLEHDKFMNEIEKCGETVFESIRSDYNKSVYDELETAYENTITTNVLKALWAAVEKNLNVISAPRAAVKEAYNRNLESYKYTYYTGSSSNIANSTKYKTFDLYLESVATSVKGETVTGKQAVKDTLWAEAEAQVKDTMKVYILANAVNESFNLKGSDKELKVAGSDIKNFASIQAQIQYIYTQQQVSADSIIKMYGENNIRTYILFDRTMAYLTEQEDHDHDGDDENTDHSLKYVRLTYTIKADDSTGEDSEG